MDNRGAIKRVFPGNNTSQGFYSFYDHILPEDATRFFIIKGGPGVGKSTLMKKIGEAMIEMGYDTEYHHCSSDNNSLDGVVFPQIGVALIDGTSPHIVDPKHPGAVDEIVYLGDYWHEEGVRQCRTEIMEANREVSICFERAYRFLRAAQVVYDDWEAVVGEGMDFARANQLADELIRELFGSMRVASRAGSVRRLFASAITPDGMMNYLYSILGRCHKKYVIEGEPGTGKSVLLEKVARAACERNHAVELYHCPLNPSKIEHVIIPGLSTALTKSIEPHTYTPSKGDTIIDMNQCLSYDFLKAYPGRIATNSELFDRLFGHAISFIGQAKRAHDRMERYYIANMDFGRIEKLREQLLERILRYAREVELKAVD